MPGQKYFDTKYSNRCYLYSGEYSEWRYAYRKEKAASLSAGTYTGLRLKLIFILPIWDMQSSLIWLSTFIKEII